jgi:cyclase
MEEMGAGELIINSVDRDGSMEGYDIELIKAVSDSVTIPVVALGGAGKVEDLNEAVQNGHASAVAAGSMFVFHGPRRAVLINYPQTEELKNIFK